MPSRKWWWLWKATLSVGILCWGGGARSGSLYSEIRKCLDSSGKTGCEIGTNVKCLSAEGNPPEEKRSCRVGSEGRLLGEARSLSTVPIFLKPTQASPFFHFCDAVCADFTMGTQQSAQIMYFSVYFFLSPWIGLPPFLRRNIKETTFCCFISSSPFPEIYRRLGLPLWLSW